MDNVTHTLAGLLAAELFAQHRARRGAEVSHWVRPAYFTSAAANNLPDLDFIYTGITGGKLGYLLHHRGHTHTLLAAIPLAAVALGLGLWWLRRSAGAERVTRADGFALALLALLGPLLHVGMDYCNSYGVHPFWPAYDGWVYGDAVFIVEPLLWATTVPALLMATRARIGRVLLALVLLATVVLPWVTGFVPPLLATLVVLVTLVMSIVAWRASRLRNALVATAASLVVYALFATSATVARAKVLTLLARDFPASTLHDVAMSPLPANPLCWSLIAVHTETGRLYERRARFALLPALLAADRCPGRDASGEITAPLASVLMPPSAALVYDGQFVAGLDELRELRAANCQMAALLRYARVPFWKRDADLVIGDLRYDREPGLGFAELSVPPVPARCPRFVPSWLPPRGDVLLQP